MASYSNSSYSNSFYDLTGVYFNSTNQSSSSSSVDLDVLDSRYLIKSSGGTISNNLIVSGSVDIQTSLTIPNIGNVENALDGKQDLISDGDLSISKTDGLQTALTGLDELTGSHTTQISSNDTDITALQGRLDIEEPKTTALQTLTATHTTDIASNTNNIASLDVDLFTEQQKTTALQTLTATHTTNIASNTANILTKQNTITDGSLTIARTSGLQTALNAKQATITTSTSLSLDILTAKNIISQNTTGELTIEGNGLNFDAYLDIKNIARAQVLTLDGGWYRIRSSGGGSTNGILTFEKLSPVDGTLLLTPLSILNNGDILTQKNLYVGQNTTDTTTKSIFFGGAFGDNTYNHTVIENRIYQ
jgi:hypothetical protein